MNYGKWSTISGIIFVLTLSAYYTIAPEQPEGIITVLIQVLFFTAIITGLLSLIFSFLGFRKKEKGFLKMVAPILVLLVLLVFAILFIGLIIGLPEN